MQKNIKVQNLNFAILYETTRKNRLGIRFVNFIATQIKNRGHKGIIIDPLEVKLPLLDKRHADFEKSKVPKNVQKIQKILDKANAFIIVSAEYNHLPPPAIINLLNYYYFL